MPHKGYKQTEEHRKKCGDARRGESNPMKGKKRPDLAAYNRSRTGMKLTEEHKEKIVRRGEDHPRYGKKMSAEFCEKISKALTGRKLSDECRMKISAFMKKRPVTQAARDATSRAHKGKKLTDEQKAAISRANMGRKGNRDFRHTDETRQKISEALLKGRKRETPEDVLLRLSPEGKRWRQGVFARDNWTCQECGVRGRGLECHHKLPFAAYPEMRFELSNGTTLCKKCHKNKAKETVCLIVNARPQARAA